MNSTYQFSYWEKDTFLKPYDLIVIGAGIVGLSSALFYKREHPSARVLVLDKGMIPEGASTRNAGFACIGSITEHLADLGKESEDGIKKRILKRYEGLQLLKHTLGEEAIGYEACGGYELFTNEHHFEEAVSHIRQFNNWISDLIGEDEVYKSEILNGYPVISNRLEGALHPGKMMQRYCELAITAGVEIKWNMQVSDINKDGRVTIGNNRELRAGKVLVAANGFASRLLPELSIHPARGFVLVTNELQSMPWKGTFHHDRGYVYFRNIGNRLLLGGARNVAADDESTADFGTNTKIKNHLLDFARTTLNLEKEWHPEYEWSGIMGFTETKTPIVKSLDNHRYVAAGLSGMGVAIGTKVGQQAAALLKDN